jgi:hypothetical protein
VDWSDWRAWLQRAGSADWAAGQWAPAPWEQEPRGGEIPLTVRAFAEDEPGDRMRDQLAMIWPARPDLASEQECSQWLNHTWVNIDAWIQEQGDMTELTQREPQIPRSQPPAGV